jgi:hypothetical protein
VQVRVQQHVNLEKEIYLLAIMELHILEVALEAQDKVVQVWELLALMDHVLLTMVVEVKDKEQLQDILQESKA